MKAVIFAEAGTLFGYGHLMRCLALAQGIKERSVKVSFVIRGNGDFSELLSEFSYKQIEWLKSTNLKDFYNKNDIAVVDSYYADEILCREIYSGFKTVIFLDDYKRINYPGGYVLNGVIGAERLKYPTSSNITYLLGPRYQPLRKEFWKVSEYVVRKNISSVMITFGGSDITNKTSIYMKKVREFYSDADITVIIGKGFKNINTIKEALDKKIELVYYPSALRMRSIMLDSDLVISAAGQTISELACVGIPTIGIQVADNQKNNIRFWQEANFLLTEKILEEDIDLFKRKMISDNGRLIIDGQGVRRIMDFLLC